MRDYLSSLINERSQPWKGGMAVTSHDLMVAAKTAGQKCEYSTGGREGRGMVSYMLLCCYLSSLIKLEVTARKGRDGRHIT